ncbi:MAG: hypothetical protein NUW02_01025 [Candidatus Campbellbacteria bacterium]|nr:hypothetical protein [Candidatus Campbellbacteria bacterium]
MHLSRISFLIGFCLSGFAALETVAIFWYGNETAHYEWAITARLTVGMALMIFGIGVEVFRKK